MRRLVLRSTSFARAAKRWLKKYPHEAEKLRAVLTQLSEDAYEPSLKTHKLSGDLQGFWACRVSDDQRIVFAFVDHQGSEAILLQTIGTHDEVY